MIGGECSINPKTRRCKKSLKSDGNCKLSVKGRCVKLKQSKKNIKKSNKVKKKVKSHKIKSHKIIKSRKKVKSHNVGFDKVEVMKYKELRPREVLSDTSKLSKYVNWFMSEKIDGWQALWDGNNTLYTKSYKRTFAVPSSWLNLLPNIPLAGEIKIKGKHATEVARLQKSSPMWKDAYFHVFDLPGSTYRNKPFKKRVVDIVNIVNHSCKTIPNCPLIASKQFKVNSVKQILDLYTNVLKNKGEGLVLTDPDSLYQTDGKRSKNRVKLKGRNDSEAVVIGYKLGGKMGMKSLEVDFEGVIFNLGIGFTRVDRENYLNVFPMGTVVKFSYRELAVSGKPKEARFVSIRND